MKKHTITTKQFDELNKEEKKQVLKNYWDINVEHDDWDNLILKGIEKDLTKAGFKNPNIQYSGFGRQGDGLSFAADVEVIDWLKKHKLATKYKTLAKLADEYGLAINITQNDNQYYHENTMGWDYMLDIPDLTDEQETELGEAGDMILREARTMAKKGYKNLEEGYYELTGDESVADTLMANEYDFYQGKIW